VAGNILSFLSTSSGDIEAEF